MALLSKSKKLKKQNFEFETINYEEIIETKNLKLIFEEDETGKLSRYSFAKLNNDGNLVVLHNGKVLQGKKNPFICSAKIFYCGCTTAKTATTTNVKDMFKKYSNHPTLLAMRIERNITFQEKQQLDNATRKRFIDINTKTQAANGMAFATFSIIEAEKRSFLRDIVLPTTRFVLDDKEQLFVEDNKNTIKIKSLINFETHLNKIAFNNNGKNYPVEYEKEILQLRENKQKERKNSIPSIDCIYEPIL